MAKGYLDNKDIKYRAIEPGHGGLSVENAYAGSLPAGTLVYISGVNTTTGKFKVDRASNDNNIKGAVYVTVETIAQSGFGRVALGSVLRNVDTSAWTSAGDPVYLGVAGVSSGYATTIPTNLNSIKQIVGYVQVKSSTVGVIVFNLREAVTQAIPASSIPQELIRYTTGTITNAEALALRATPKQLLAAPGAGTVAEFVSLELYFDYTAAYTESTANLAVRYKDASGTIVSQAIEATGFADATADTRTNGLPKIDSIAAKTACDNQALVLHNTGAGEWGGGNAANAIYYKLAYRLHNPGW